MPRATTRRPGHRPIGVAAAESLSLGGRVRFSLWGGYAWQLAVRATADRLVAVRRRSYRSVCLVCTKSRTTWVPLTPTAIGAEFIRHLKPGLQRLVHP